MTAAICDDPAVDMPTDLQPIAPCPTDTPPRQTAAAPPRSPGRGWLEVHRIEQRSIVTRALAHSPLRLLTPRNCPGDAAWVFTSTFGGGLVAGDQIDLNVRVGSDASCAIATQASTKAFRSTHGMATRQALTIHADADSTCVVLPDPLTCFTGAIFEQCTRIELNETASLVLVDWLTSGRRARGERWAFRRYSSRIVAMVASAPVFRDAVLLDEMDGPIAGEHRMGQCDCFGIVLLLGKRVQPASDAILRWAAAEPVIRGESLIFAASPIPGGAVIRVAGPKTEAVGRWIRERLSFLPDLLGGDPWARKW